MKAKVIIPLILLVVLVTALILYASGWLRSPAAEQIAFSGNVELTEVRVSFKVPGKIQKLTVREGDRVSKGQVLAVLDRSQLTRQRERVEAARAAASARVDQMATTIDFQVQNLEGLIAQREAEVSSAQAALDELLAGSRKQDVEQARAGLERAQTELETAERDWRRAETLFGAEDISAAAHDQAKVRYEVASSAFREAGERLSLVQEGPRQETIDAARAQLRRAQAGLRLADATRLEIKRSRQEREARLSDLDAIEAELAGIDVQLSDAVAISPIDGVVLTKSAEEGEVVAAGTTLLALGDVENPWLRGYVGERDLGRIKLGTPVRISTDSYPDKIYPGTISFIASEAEFTPKQIQTQEERVKLVYRVKVRVENPNHELKSNMPADAVIILDQDGQHEDR
jgi:HlyD family secretion protein